MSRTLFAVLAVLFLASCGGGYNSAPRNLENACSIVSERPEYLRAFKATERKWGVPVHVQMATLYQESKFIGDARPPYRYTLGIIPMGRQSTAFRRDTGRRGAKRDRIRDASDFMGWYMAGTREALGISMSDARNQYLAYHEGRTGYARGSYKRKSWLMRVSGDVEARASMYARQLQGCGRA